MFYDFLAALAVALIGGGLALYDPRLALVGVGIALFIVAIIGATNAARRDASAPTAPLPGRALASMRETRCEPPHG